MQEATNTFTLQQENELRVEVAFQETATIKLLKGTAEVFGAEIAVERAYQLTGCNIAVFTWHGAVVEVSGQYHAYAANETPMVRYSNIHAVLDARRKAAMAKGPKAAGPIVVIAGPTDTGKSTLAKILSNYAARLDRKPIYVDLDVGQGCITVPSMLAALPVDRPLDIEEGFQAGSPITFFFGGTSPGSNQDCYKQQVVNLATHVRGRMDESPVSCHSGVIVNTCGWVDGDGFQLLLHSVRSFKADVVLVLDHERLFNDLQQQLRSEQVEIVKLPKSGGVVTRTTAFRRRTRTDAIKQYFYGPASDLCPQNTFVKFADVSIFRISTGPRAPASALPIGFQDTHDPLGLEKMTPSNELVNKVLSVSYSTSEEDILGANIAGYVVVKEVDLKRQSMKVLSPCPGPLPGKFLLMGELTWME